MMEKFILPSMAIPCQKKEDHESAASLGLWWGSTKTLRQRFFAV
nr:hypothetical protein [Paenarthrobacter nicotinovorans]